MDMYDNSAPAKVGTGRKRFTTIRMAAVVVALGLVVAGCASTTNSSTSPDAKDVGGTGQPNADKYTKASCKVGDYDADNASTSTRIVNSISQNVATGPLDNSQPPTPTPTPTPAPTARDAINLTQGDKKWNGGGAGEGLNNCRPVPWAVGPAGQWYDWDGNARGWPTWWGQQKTISWSGGPNGYVDWTCTGKPKSGGQRGVCPDSALTDARIRAKWDTNTGSDLGSRSNWPCTVESGTIVGCWTAAYKDGAWDGAWDFNATAFATAFVAQIRSTAIDVKEDLANWVVTSATTSGAFPDKKSPIGTVVPGAKGSGGTFGVASWGNNIRDQVQTMEIKLQPSGGTWGKESEKPWALPEITARMKFSIGSDIGGYDKDNSCSYYGWRDNAPTEGHPCYQLPGKPTFNLPSKLASSKAGKAAAGRGNKARTDLPGAVDDSFSCNVSNTTTRKLQCVGSPAGSSESNAEALKSWNISITSTT